MPGPTVAAASVTKNFALDDRPPTLLGDIQAIGCQLAAAFPKLDRDADRSACSPTDQFPEPAPPGHGLGDIMIQRLFEKAENIKQR